MARARRLELPDIPLRQRGAVAAVLRPQTFYSASQTFESQTNINYKFLIEFFIQKVNMNAGIDGRDTPLRNKMQIRESSNIVLAVSIKHKIGCVAGI